MNRNRIPRLLTMLLIIIICILGCCANAYSEVADEDSELTYFDTVLLQVMDNNAKEWMSSAQSRAIFSVCAILDYAVQKDDSFDISSFISKPGPIYVGRAGFIVSAFYYDADKKQTLSVIVDTRDNTQAGYAIVSVGRIVLEMSLKQSCTDGYNLVDIVDFNEALDEFKSFLFEDDEQAEDNQIAEDKEISNDNEIEADEIDEILEDKEIVEGSGTDYSSILGLSKDKFKETVKSDDDYQQCQVGNDEALRYSYAKIGPNEYDADAYYVFGGNGLLTKIAYVLKDSDNYSEAELDQCLQAMVDEMKEKYGEPDSSKGNSFVWKEEKYKIELGKGKLSQYTGSKSKTVGLIIKDTVTRPIATGDGWEILKKYRYNPFSGSYYYSFVLKNTSGFNARITANIIFYDANDNIVGVGSNTEYGCENGYETYWSFSNDMDFDHVSTEISVEKETSYRDGSQSSIELSTDVVGKKIIITAKNIGEYPVEFLEYHVLFFDEKGEVISTGLGFLSDNDYEIKPGATEMRDESSYSKEFADVAVYAHGRISKW